MTDQTDLAALLIEVFPAANRNQWPFEAMDVAASLHAAGVRVTGDAGLREAAQAVVDAAKETPDALGRPSVVFGDVMDAIDALRAALATEEKP